MQSARLAACACWVIWWLVVLAALCTSPHECTPYAAWLLRGMAAKLGLQGGSWVGPDSAALGAAAGRRARTRGEDPLQQQGAWEPVQTRMNALTLTGWLRCPDRCQDFTGGLKMAGVVAGTPRQPMPQHPERALRFKARWHGSPR